MRITSLRGREIIDSRGNPTVEVDLTIETEDRKPETGNRKLETGNWKQETVRAAAPSGASTGAHEAAELRDGGTRYNGKGVLNAVENINKKIAKSLIGKNIKNQEDADERMIKLDGTKNKSALGANAIVAVSIAIAKALAASEKKEYFEFLGGKKIPQPMFNIINGGKHAGSMLAIQEFMIMPKSKTFAETLRMACEIYAELGKILASKYGYSARNVGDEGGFAPQIKRTEEALEVIARTISQLGYEKETSLAIDAAASSFYDSVTKTYFIDEKNINADSLFDYYVDLTEHYPIKSIEDPFEEEDFFSFSELTDEVGAKVQIVGDDLLVTNPLRIKKAIEQQACNALLLKVNQIGTVSEALKAAEAVRRKNWKIVVSHRSGETEDTFISDLAVGIESEFIKAGAPARGERTAKYNRLLRIEENLEKNV